MAVAGKGGLLEKDAISKEAIDKLTDQRLLMIVATRSRSTVDASSVSLELRLAAAEKITDQALLAKIAIEDDSSEVRAAALKNLTDQSALASEAIQADVTGNNWLRRDSENHRSICPREVATAAASPRIRAYAATKLSRN